MLAGKDMSSTQGLAVPVSVIGTSQRHFLTSTNTSSWVLGTGCVVTLAVVTPHLLGWELQKK